ncbi:hypothetical protein BGX26_002586, partial [Mortierella sp. AD094]
NGVPKTLTVSPGLTSPSTGLTEYFMGAFVLNLNPTGVEDKILSFTLETIPGATLEAIVSKYSTLELLLHPWLPSRTPGLNGFASSQRSFASSQRSFASPFPPFRFPHLEISLIQSNLIWHHLVTSHSSPSSPVLPPSDKKDQKKYRSSSAQPSAPNALSLRGVRNAQQEARSNVLARPTTSKTSKPSAATTPPRPFLTEPLNEAETDISQDDDMQGIESDSQADSDIDLKVPEVTWTPVERKSHHRGYEFRIPLDDVEEDSAHEKPNGFMSPLLRQKTPIESSCAGDYIPQEAKSAADDRSVHLARIPVRMSEKQFKKFRHQLCDKGIWHLEQLTNNANTHLCTWDDIKTRLQCQSRTPLWYSALRRNICVEEPDNFIQVTFTNDNHTLPTHLTIDNDKLARLGGNLPPMPPLITIPAALSTVGGVHADHYSAWLMKNLAMEPTHSDKLQIYTDDSLVNMGTKDISMAFSAVRKNEPTKRRRAVAGRVMGYASSTKAELMGLLAAIQSVAPSQDVHIQLDSKAVVTRFEMLITQRQYTTLRTRLRQHYSTIWAVIAKTVAERTGSTRVSWIKGHSGIYENELADGVAKTAQARDSVPWETNTDFQDDILFQPMFLHHRMEADLRKLLRMQSHRRAQANWTSSHRAARCFRLFRKDIDWLVTHNILHDKIPMATWTTFFQNSHARTFNIKRAHDMLPTLSSINARYPDLYPSDSCFCCDSDTPEHNEHLWRCPASWPARRAIWDKAIQDINNTGTDIVRNLKLLHPNDDKLTWTNSPSFPLEAVLDTQTSGYDAIRANDRAGDELQRLHRLALNECWSVDDFYRGLVPTWLTASIHKIYKTPTRVAREVAFRFCLDIAQNARELIWKPRCKMVNEWEKAHGITAALKRRTRGAVRATGPPDNDDAWALPYYGADGSDLFCSCGATREQHLDGNCPMAESALAADQSLLTSLLGTSTLNFMERLGGAHQWKL